MKERLMAWREKVDALSDRERILVFAVVASLLVFVLMVLLIDPLMDERDRQGKDIKRLQQQIRNQNNALTVIEAELQVGVNRQKQQRRDRLQEQVVRLDQRIEESVVAMIPPQMMTEVLEQVLSQGGKLKLLALENLPVAPIIEQSAASPQSAEQAQPPVEKLGLYKHRFVLTLQGNYLATVRYFEQLNQLPWRFHWDSLNYEVTDFPNAVITLQVHTVSRSEDWIGV
jgi:MSHA biogenesis protein MshJ